MSRVHLVVLGMLKEKPMYGYEFKYFIEERSLEHWARINLPAVYKALQALEEKGYVSGKKEIEGNNPPRTVYHITESGSRYMSRMVIKNLKHPKNKPDFWVAIAFMLGTIEYETARALIQRQLGIEENIHRKILFDSMKKQSGIPFNGKILMELGLGFHETEKRCLSRLLEEMAKPENRQLFISEGTK